ncbi:hypothetical protein REPUB_Repub13aG0134700 [Reevesia pubescens]
MMDLLLPNLVEITLEKFERCDQLPPLGKLCFLKKLTFSGMGAIKSVDINFYGDENSFPFTRDSHNRLRTMLGGIERSEREIKFSSPKFINYQSLS